MFNFRYRIQEPISDSDDSSIINVKLTKKSKNCHEKNEREIEFDRLFKERNEKAKKKRKRILQSSSEDEDSDENNFQIYDENQKSEFNMITKFMNSRFDGWCKLPSCRKRWSKGNSDMSRNFENSQIVVIYAVKSLGN